MQTHQDILQGYYESACKFANEANLRTVQVQHDVAKEKTQYFEKIAITAGGTIAVVVSFMGAHPGKLSPPWVLRSALVTLVLTMIAAMARNWRYPFYIIASYVRQYVEAISEREESKLKLIVSGAPPLEGETLEPFDMKKYREDYDKGKLSRDKQIADCKRAENRAYWQTAALEYISLILIIAGMSMLVVLAWKNF